MVKVNKIIIILELVIISFPITLLLLIVGIPAGIVQLLYLVDFSNTSIALITIMSLGATFSVWKIAIMHLRSFSVLNPKLRIYWYLIFLGIIISVIPIIWTNVGQPELYSPAWYFYDQLTMFTIGIGLAIPSIHTFISARLNENR